MAAALAAVDGHQRPIMAAWESGQGGAINFARRRLLGGFVVFRRLDINFRRSIANDGEGGAPAFEGDGLALALLRVTFDLLVGHSQGRRTLPLGSDGSGAWGRFLDIAVPHRHHPQLRKRLLPDSPRRVSTLRRLAAFGRRWRDGKAGMLPFNLWNGGKRNGHQS